MLITAISESKNLPTYCPSYQGGRRRRIIALVSLGNLTRLRNKAKSRAGGHTSIVDHLPRTHEDSIFSIEKQTNPLKMPRQSNAPGCPQPRESAQLTGTSSPLLPSVGPGGSELRSDLPAISEHKRSSFLLALSSPGTQSPHVKEQAGWAPGSWQLRGGWFVEKTGPGAGTPTFPSLRLVATAANR